MKKRKKILIVVLSSFIVLFFYIFSYAFILPISEKCGFQKLVYFLYEPIEYLRLKLDKIYYLTENGYEICYGNVQPEDRYYFNTKRRIIKEFNGHKHEMFYKNGIVIFTRTWYKNGKLWKSNIFKNGINDGNKKVFFNNGKLHFQVNVQNSEDGGIEIEDGTYLWQDGDGKVVAKCIFKDGQPYNGTVILKSKGFSVLLFSGTGVFLNTFLDYEFDEWIKRRYYKNGRELKEEDIYITKDGKVSFRSTPEKSDSKNDINIISGENIPDIVLKKVLGRESGYVYYQHIAICFAECMEKNKKIIMAIFFWHSNSFNHAIRLCSNCLLC